MAGGRGAPASDRLVRIVSVLAFGVVVTLNAWLCDDAYITFRQVENLLDGYGFVWNTAERVQAFTHPLWALLLVPFQAVSGEPFYTTMVLGIALALATAALVAFRIARGTSAAVLGCVVLLLSRAVVDYATSGLENGLTHLLLAAIFALAYVGTPSRRALEAACLCGGLLVVNRLDLILIAVPLLALPVHRAGPQLSWRRATVIFAAPIAAWELFALVYFGSLVPNTAYAKLGIDVARGALAVKGGQYLLGMSRHDPVGTAAVFAALIFALRDRALRGIGVALLAYVAYTIWIGGDFMVARYYSPLVVLAVCLLARVAPEVRSARAAALVGVPLGLLAFATQTTTLGLPDPVPFSECTRKNGPTDERCVYFPFTSLLIHESGVRLPVHPWAAEGARLRAAREKVFVARQIGFLGYHAGPDVHVIDVHGLSDPFLARLPPQRQVHFYPGHWYRHPDPEYVQSLRAGAPVFADARLAEIYRRVQSATRGPIFGAQRWSDVLSLMFHGVPEDELDVDRWRHAEMVRLLDAPAPPVPDGARGGSPRTLLMIDDGAELRLTPPRPAREIEVALGEGVDWTVVFRGRGGSVEVPVDTVGQDSDPRSDRPHLARVRIPVPRELRSRLDAIRVLPESGHRPQWWIGDVQVR